ncbi:hypothetical protein TPAU25S_02571 [Tsukamurella paurometabola]
MPDNDSGGGLSAFGVSIDELSLLMRLADVTELAPIVLAVHPNVYRPDDQSAVDLAVLPGLIAAGLVDADGAIDPEVARWLRALQAPAAEIALRVFDGDSALRGAIVRHDDLVVVVFRHDDLLTLQGYRTDGEDFDSTVVDPVWRVLGSCDPADFDSLTLGAAELREIVSMYNPASTDPRGEREFRGRLREHDLPAHRGRPRGRCSLQRAARRGGLSPCRSQWCSNSSSVGTRRDGHRPGTGALHHHPRPGR